MSNNYCRRSGLRQPVPDAHSPKIMLKWRLLKKKRFTGQQTWQLTSMCNFRSVYPMLQLKPPPAVSLVRTTLEISWSEIDSMTSNDQMRFKKEFSNCLVKFEAWWKAISIQDLRKTIEQHEIHFGYPMMNLVSHISASIWWIGSGTNFTMNISELLHTWNVKQVYHFTHNLNYIWQMLKHNDQCTGLDHMEETLSYLVLQGWYDIDPAKVFNLLSTADNQQNSPRAHLLHLQHCQA